MLIVPPIDLFLAKNVSNRPLNHCEAYFKLAPLDGPAIQLMAYLQVFLFK